MNECRETCRVNPYPDTDYCPLPTTPAVNGSQWTVLHDFGFLYGGAERVTRDICDAIRTTNPLRYIAGDKEVLTKMSPHHSPIVNFSMSKGTYRLASPIYGDILRRTRPIDGNIIASSYAFCHHVPATGLRVVYCHSPFRQAWSGSAGYRSQGAFVQRAAAKAFGERWRRQDRLVARASAYYIATSTAVAIRISKYYGLEPVAIIPPAYDDSVYVPAESEQRGDGYLWVGRIVEPYKNLGMVIDYFNQHPSKELIVAGAGRDRHALESRANHNIRFVGWQSEQELVMLYRTAKALIFPSEDDFGITPVEAMACGLPVIAYRAGGALDTVIDGETGIFFADPTQSSLQSAIEQFELVHWDGTKVADSVARRYGTKRFTDDLSRLLVSLER
jgi:glycosyltransferase involved in cell wall biosynthesis